MTEDEIDDLIRSELISLDKGRKISIVTVELQDVEPLSMESKKPTQPRKHQMKMKDM